eukprot:gene45561-28250_t
MAGVTNADLRTVADAGFNTILAYGYGDTGLPADGAVTSDLPLVKRFLDNATAHGLQRHDMVRVLDTDHVTYSVLNSGPTIGLYTNVSEMVPEINDLIRSIKGHDQRTSVCVTQIFGWEDYCGDDSSCNKTGTANKTEPPAAAKRAMAFAALTLGCRGLGCD